MGRVINEIVSQATEGLLSILSSEVKGPLGSRCIVGTKDQILLCPGWIRGKTIFSLVENKKKTRQFPSFLMRIKG